MAYIFPQHCCKMNAHTKKKKKSISYLCIAYLVWDGITCDMSSIFYLLYGLLRGKENKVFVKKSLENDFNHVKLSAQLTMKKDEMKLMCNFSEEDLPSLICILVIWLLFCSLHDFTWLLIFHSVNTDTSVLLFVEQQVSLPRKKMEFSSMWSVNSYMQHLAHNVLGVRIYVDFPFFSYFTNSKAQNQCTMCLCEEASGPLKW